MPALGVLLRVKRAGPRIVQLVYEKGVVTKQYHSESQARSAFVAWKRFANR